MPNITVPHPVVEPAASEPETVSAGDHDPKYYTDRDETLFPEAVKHIFTPRRRRTNVSPEFFAAVLDAVNKP